MGTRGGSTAGVRTGVDAALRENLDAKMGIGTQGLKGFVTAYEYNDATAPFVDDLKKNIADFKKGDVILEMDCPAVGSNEEYEAFFEDATAMENYKGYLALPDSHGLFVFSPRDTLPVEEFIDRLKKEGMQVRVKQGALNEDWITAKMGNMVAQMVYFDEPSAWGIKGKGYSKGRLSKLWISEQGRTVVEYDRGWGVKPPEDGMARDFYDSIVDLARTKPRGPQEMHRSARRSSITSTGVSFQLDSIDDNTKAIINRCFPDYKGKKVEISDSIPGSMNSYWDGGSRNTWAIYDLDTGKAQHVPSNHPFFESDRPRTMNDFFGTDELPKNKLLVEHSIFQGKDMGIRIYGHAEKVLPMLHSLPEPVSDHEKTVLKFTRSLKSSYAGIKNYRFKEAKRETGITESQWESAKQALIDKKLLTKAGAITPRGQNALGR